MVSRVWIRLALVALFVAAAGKIGQLLVQRPSVDFSPEVQLWRQSGHYHLFENKHLIFYKDGVNVEAASADTLVILHGYPTCSFDFHRVWGHLSNRFRRVVVYDFIGFGLSDKPLHFNYTVHAYADIYFSLLESLDLERDTKNAGGKLHLLAHDLGDSVAQEILARLIETKAEDSLASATFLNGGIFPHLHRPRLVQRLLLNPVLGPVIGQFMSFSAFSRAFSEVFGDVQPTEKELQEHYNLIKANNGLANAHKLIRYINDRQEHAGRWVGALKTKIPIAFINGPKDPVSGQHMVNNFKAQVPHQTAIVLSEGVAHYPQIEAPEETMKEFFAFLHKL